MGGFFGVVSRTDCVTELFYGTDYHSHLGMQRGGLAVRGRSGFRRFIHDIRATQFRSKLEPDLAKLEGTQGIGVISDYEDQPLLIGSHLGNYALVTVGRIRNLDALAQEAFRARATHFSEMGSGALNPTEVVATLINRESSFEKGIRRAQEKIEGSCSLLLLSEDALYAARDYAGRTPVVLGEKDGSRAASLESCALPNLGFAHTRDLGPGEVVRLTPDRVDSLMPPQSQMRICAFLWVYYGYPASTYEGQNVEVVRNRCGACLARRETESVDCIGGIPDSGIAHGVGFATESGIPYRRPYVKYTPTWPRSFMPQNQGVRDLVARMKLIPIGDLIRDTRLLFCEDSIVRGTQLKDTIRRLFSAGAREVHMRVACPPLMFSCPFLNFSRSHSELDLVARRVVEDIEGGPADDLKPYLDPSSDRYADMVKGIGASLGLTTLRYQRLDDLISAIGLPADRICTTCWTGNL